MIKLSGFALNGRHKVPLKFIYSKKATKFCKISTNYLSYLLPVKWLVEILQNFVAFSEYINFKSGQKWCVYSYMKSQFRSTINWSYWKKFAPLMLTAKSATRKPTLTAKEHFVYSQILNGQLWSSFALCEVHSNPESSWVTEVAATNAQWTI